LASRNARITLGLAILGPTYSVYDVTRQDLQLARELDLVASMHVAGVTSNAVGAMAATPQLEL
jgi:hypothetical protein